MWYDHENIFDQDAPITVTRNSTNAIDLKRAAQDIGIGEEITIRVSVATAFTAVGAATLNIALVTDDNAALTSPTNLQDQSVVIPVADLIIGFERVFTILPSSVMEQYLGLVYTVATGPMTAGAIDAAVVESVQGWKAYPRNYATT
jgi:hypothetical protein